MTWEDANVLFPGDPGILYSWRVRWRIFQRAPWDSWDVNLTPTSNAL